MYKRILRLCRFRGETMSSRPIYCVEDVCWITVFKPVKSPLELSKMQHPSSRSKFMRIGHESRYITDKNSQESQNMQDYLKLHPFVSQWIGILRITTVKSTSQSNVWFLADGSKETWFTPENLTGVLYTISIKTHVTFEKLILYRGITRFSRSSQQTPPIRWHTWHTWPRILMQFWFIHHRAFCHWYTAIKSP